jgi:hypothetical protein
MALFIPQIQTEFVLQRLLDSDQFNEFLAAGVLNMTTLEELSPIIGDYVNVPRLINVPDFARVDLTSTTPQTGTAVATNNQKYPIIHDETLSTFKDSDMERTGEDFNMKLSQRVGDKVAKRTLSQIGNVLNGSVPAGRTLDRTGQSLTVQHIRKARQLAGDQAGFYNTLVCHSQAWSALLNDMLSTYRANPSIAGVCFDGRTKALLGITNIVISDAMPTVAGGFTTAGDNNFSSFICRPDAIMFGYQAEPKPAQTWNDIRVPGDLTYFKAKMAYTLGLEGVTWIGGANPLDSDFGNSANWQSAYSDLREIGAVKIIAAGDLGN